LDLFFHSRDFPETTYLAFSPIGLQQMYVSLRSVNYEEHYMSKHSAFSAVYIFHSENFPGTQYLALGQDCLQYW